MKILMHTRIDLKKFWGGDLALVELFRSHLQEEGVEVQVTDQIKPNLTGVDIVHLYNLVRIQEAILQLEHAKKYKKLVVLTPVYDDFSVINPQGRNPLFRFTQEFFGKDPIEFTKGLGLLFTGRARLDAFLNQSLKGYCTLQRALINSCDLIITLSHAETRLLTGLFGRHRYEVCHCGANIDEFEGISEKTFRESSGIKGKFALCVGLFSERKNQLGIIKALRNNRIKVVFVGRPAPFYSWYYKRCRMLAGNNHFFIDSLDRKLLLSAYKAAQVHISASYWEAAGLANLEAACAGCNIVSSNCEVLKEYFADRAFYCNPFDLKSIRLAIEQSMDAKRDSKDTSAWIRQNYSWKKSAKKLLQIYKSITAMA